MCLIKAIYNERIKKYLSNRTYQIYQNVLNPSLYGCILYQGADKNGGVEKLFEVTCEDNSLILDSYGPKEKEFLSKIGQMQDTGNRIWKEIEDGSESFDFYLVLNMIAIQIARIEKQ